MVVLLQQLIIRLIRQGPLIMAMVILIMAILIVMVLLILKLLGMEYFVVVVGLVPFCVLVLHDSLVRS